MHRVLMDDRYDTTSATPSSKFQSHSSAGDLDVLYTTPREMPPAREGAHVRDAAVEGLRSHCLSPLPAADKEEGKGGQPSFSPVSRV